MRLWRLSTRASAGAFDGGYGLLFDGRWNRIGLPITYAATSPSLCVLEKLVHIEDPQLLPPLTMVSFDIPDSVVSARLKLSDLPRDWRAQEALTQQMGNDWLVGLTTPLLIVPSAVVPIVDSPDENVLINHRHPAASAITIVGTEPFALDLRLL